MDVADNAIIKNVENQATKSTSTSRLLAVEVIKLHHIWTIDNFSRYWKNFNTTLVSTDFSNPQAEKFKWYLELKIPRFNGKTEPELDEASQIFFTVYLGVKVPPIKRNSPFFMSAKFKISILNSKNERVFEKKSDLRNFHGQVANRSGLDIIKRNDLLKNSKEWLANGKLRILCEISMYDTTSHKDTAVDFNNPSKLLDDLWSLYENQICTDVTLLVNDKEFCVHKAVLAAGSAVFRAMFRHEMEERKQNRVDITDINHQVVNEMLRFIYTGKTLNLDGIAADLLVAADKYALEKLKVLCETELSSNLLVENVVEMLVFADLHSAGQLKAKAINFIKTHGNRVRATPGWKDITKYPHLMDEIICAYASYSEKASASEAYTSEEESEYSDYID